MEVILKYCYRSASSVHFINSWKSIHFFACGLEILLGITEQNLVHHTRIVVMMRHFRRSKSLSCELQIINVIIFFFLIKQQINCSSLPSCPFLSLTSPMNAYLPIRERSSSGRVLKDKPWGFRFTFTQMQILKRSFKIFSSFISMKKSQRSLQCL